MKLPLITDIQKYSIHDGDGIRTTIFFKGCPLRCLWCHNPETQRYEKEMFLFYDRCTACGACVKKCPHHANAIQDGKLLFSRSDCTACGACLDCCVGNAREIFGSEYSVEALVREAEKDRMFYEASGGGITLSGGEVLANDMDYVEALCMTLHKKGYSVNIDTCGHVPYEHFQRILPYTDTFLYDIKLMDSAAHKRFTGVDNVLILNNLIRLSADGAKIFIRIPVIGGINDTEENMLNTITFLRDNQIRVQRVNLLPYHDTGSGKYQKLGMERPSAEMTVPSGDRMAALEQLWKENGFSDTRLGG